MHKWQFYNYTHARKSRTRAIVYTRADEKVGFCIYLRCGTMLKIHSHEIDFA